VLPSKRHSIERESSGHLPASADTRAANGNGARAPLNERAAQLAALYARSPAAANGASSSADGPSRRPSVSRRRLQHQGDQGNDSAVARSCPVPSAFAAASEQPPFVARGGAWSSGSGLREAGSDSDSSDW